MLTFLRRIRKSFVDSGTTGKYLFYAIGEILLVVIGILIALGVNNWNQRRQALNFEKELLVELRNTGDDNLVWINFVMAGNESSKQSNMIILDHLENDRPYHDTLNRHFANCFMYWELTLTKNAFENAKDYGLYFIQNDTMRSLLSHVYENRGPFMNRLDDRLSLSYYNTVEPVIIRYFGSANTNHLMGHIHQTYEMNPIDYNMLKDAAEFKSILRTNVGNREKFAFFVNWVKQGLLELDQRIQSEIDSRN